MKPIGKTHDTIKQIRKTKNKNVRDGIAYVEQIGVLEKFLAGKNIAQFNVNTLLICEPLINTDYARDIQIELMDLATDVYTISEQTYELICEKKNNAGLFALIDFSQPSTLEFEKQDYKNIVIIDGLENPGNVGTIFRTADACGIDAIVCVDLKTMVYGKKCISSSRGMVFKIPTLSLSFEKAHDLLSSNGYTCYLCEPEDGEPYNQVTFDDKKAIIVGSERFGINDDWYDHDHKRIFIPMQGSMTSLNVGVAASLIMYECMKKIK
jgi:RNA methyltransferase, TrmH family